MIEWRDMGTKPESGVVVLLFFRDCGEALVGTYSAESGAWWAATFQTGGEVVAPDFWASIDMPRAE